MDDIFGPDNRTPDEKARYLRQSMLYNIPPNESESIEDRIDKVKRLVKYIETGE